MIGHQINKKLSLITSTTTADMIEDCTEVACIKLACCKNGHDTEIDIQQNEMIVTSLYSSLPL